MKKILSLVTAFLLFTSQVDAAQLYIVDKFKGLKLNPEAEKIEDFAHAKLDNSIIRGDNLTVIKGRDKLNATAHSDLVVNGLWYYENAAGSVKKIIVAESDELVTYDTAGANRTSIANTLTNEKWDAKQIGDVIYLSSATNGLYKWTGTGSASAVGSVSAPSSVNFTAGTAVGGLTPGNDALVSHQMYIDSSCSHYSGGTCLAGCPNIRDYSEDNTECVNLPEQFTKTCATSTTYNYKVVKYSNKWGIYSEPSDADSVTLIGNDMVSVVGREAYAADSGHTDCSGAMDDEKVLDTVITLSGAKTSTTGTLASAPSDPFDGYCVYRTVASGTDYFKLGCVVGGGTTYTDGKPDSALGDPLDTTIDTVAPPSNRYIEEYKGVLFSGEESTLQFTRLAIGSVASADTYWLATDKIDLGFKKPMTGLHKTSNSLLVFASDKVDEITGFGVGSFKVRTIVEGIGSVSDETIRTDNNGDVIFFAGVEGVYKLSVGRQDTEDLTQALLQSGSAKLTRISSPDLDNVFRGTDSQIVLTPSNYSSAHAYYDRDNDLYFLYVGTDCFIWDNINKAWSHQPNTKFSASVYRKSPSSAGQGVLLDDLGFMWNNYTGYENGATSGTVTGNPDDTYVTVDKTGTGSALSSGDSGSQLKALAYDNNNATYWQSNLSYQDSSTDITTGGTAVSSGDSGGNVKANAFDDNNATFWNSDANYQTGGTDQTTGGTSLSSGDGSTPGGDSATALLHMNGTTTTFTDSSATPHTITANGNATQTDTNAKWTKSLLLDGTGDYLSTADSADWDLGNGNFTIDLWARFTNLPSSGVYQTFFSQWGAAGQYGYTAYLHNDGGTLKLEFYYSADGTATTLTLAETVTLSTATWYHFAWVRNGTSLMVFKDGTQVGSSYNISTNTIFNSNGDLQIGALLGVNAVDGMIDEFRYLKGTAVWTSNFTAPSAEYSTSITMGKDNAFDKDTGTYWLSSGTVNGTAYIGYDLGSAKVITGFSIKHNAASKAVTSVKVQASSNGTDWSDIATQAVTANTNLQTFTFSNAASYRYWRLLANSTTTDGDWAVQEVTFTDVVVTNTLYIGYDQGSGNSENITQFSIKHHTDTKVPSSIKLQGSANGTDWSDIYAATPTADTNKQTFSFSNSSSYRFHRLLMNGASTGGDWDVEEIEFLKPGVINTVYLGYNLGSAVAITGFSLKAHTATKAPTSLKVQASDNGTDWTDVSTKTPTANTNKQSFTFTNTTAHAYWRLLLTASTTDGDWDVEEAEFTDVEITSSVADTLTDSSATFYTTGSGLAGVYVVVDTGTSLQVRRILSNTADTLTVESNFDSVLLSSYTYYIGYIVFDVLTKQYSLTKAPNETEAISVTLVHNKPATQFDLELSVYQNKSTTATSEFTVNMSTNFTDQYLISDRALWLQFGMRAFVYSTSNTIAPPIDIISYAFKATPREEA